MMTSIKPTVFSGACQNKPVSFGKKILFPHDEPDKAALDKILNRSCDNKKDSFFSKLKGIVKKESKTNQKELEAKRLEDKEWAKMTVDMELRAAQVPESVMKKGKHRCLIPYDN